MRVKELTRKEIEARFNEMGDYVKMDYLSSCLKNPIDFDTKKFVLVKLAGLYEARKMFADAGKTMKSAAEINTEIQTKIADFVKAAELYIKGGNFDLADVCVKKAISFANEKQKREVKESIKEFYKTQARFYLNNEKRNQALLAYEKLFSSELDEKERGEIVDKLLELYERLGKMERVSCFKEENRLKKKNLRRGLNGSIIVC